MRNTSVSLERFWHLVELVDPRNPDTSCWLYRGPLKESSAGVVYGEFCGELAHRIAASLYTGTRVGTVRRSCPDTTCVRREHFSTIGWEKSQDANAKIQRSRLSYDRDKDPPPAEYVDKHHPMFIEIVDNRLHKQPVLHRYLASKYQTTVSTVQKYIRKSVIDVLLAEQRFLRQRHLPVPCTPLYQTEESPPNEAGSP